MMKKHSGKRHCIQWMIILVLGVCAIMFFLCSIKTMLYSEMERKLLYTECDKSATANMKDTLTKGIIIKDQGVASSLNTKIYGYALNRNEMIAIAYSKQAYDFAQKYNIIDTNVISELLGKGKNKVTKITLNNDMPVYIAIKKETSTTFPYMVYIAQAHALDQEIQSIEDMAILVVCCIIVIILFTILYNLYKKNEKVRKSKKKAEPDSITGLMHYERHKGICQQLVNSEKNQYAYVSFSIEKFQFMNEIAGKQYCDYVLSSVAKILLNWISSEESITRYHDDLFGMLLIYKNELDFRKRLLCMFKHASDIHNFNNCYFSINFHCGVCIVTNERDVNKVISNSRKAKNRNKNKEFGWIQFYNNTTVNESLQKSMEDTMRALEDREFIVYYQPKYDMDTETMAGAEALVRWKHKRNGLLSPGVFLPILEENNMIEQLDYFVLQQVCENLQRWKEDGKQVVPVSINLSSRHLDNPSFVTEIVHIVDQYKVVHSDIEFEFAEGAVFKKIDQLLPVIEELKDAGFYISLDNFGTGLFVLSSLKDLPIDIIKVDKGLISDYDDIEYSDRDRTIVMHIISYAKEKHMKVVAQGVETKEQLDMLQEQKCDMIQGYYYHKPMKEQEFEALLQMLQEE